MRPRTRVNHRPRPSMPSRCRQTHLAPNLWPICGPISVRFQGPAGRNRAPQNKSGSRKDETGPRGTSGSRGTNYGPNERTNQECRNAGTGGGGAVGATCPHNFEAVGAAPPQLWTVNVVHFYFCLLLHVSLGLSQKIMGQLRGVFSFRYGLPWIPGDVCPRP